MDAETYSDEIKRKAERYEILKGKGNLTEEERAERAQLRIELKSANAVFGKFEEEKKL